MRRNIITVGAFLFCATGVGIATDSLMAAPANAAQTWAAPCTAQDTSGCTGTDHFPTERPAFWDRYAQLWDEFLGDVQDGLENINPFD